MELVAYSVRKAETVERVMSFRVFSCLREELTCSCLDSVEIVGREGSLVSYLISKGHGSKK